MNEQTTSKKAETVTEVTTKPAKHSRSNKNFAIFLLLGCGLCFCFLIAMGVVGYAVYNSNRVEPVATPPAQTPPPVTEPTPEPPTPQSPEEIQQAKFDKAYADSKPAIFLGPDDQAFVLEVDSLNAAPRQLTLAGEVTPLAASVNGRFLIGAGEDYQLYTNKGELFMNILPKELADVRTKHKSKDYGIGFSYSQKFSSNERYLYLNYTWSRSACDEYECIPEEISIADMDKDGLIRGATVYDLRTGKYVFISPAKGTNPHFNSADFSDDGYLFVMLAENEYTTQKGNFLKFKIEDMFKEATGKNVMALGQKFAYEEKGSFASQFDMVTGTKGYWRRGDTKGTTGSTIYEVALEGSKIVNKRKILSTQFTSHQSPTLVGDNLYFVNSAQYYDLKANKLVNFPGGQEYRDLLSPEVLLLARRSNSGLLNVYTYNTKTKVTAEIKLPSSFFDDEHAIRKYIFRD